MADVIFAGTPSRPALGMAEVKLVIDNTAEKIPVPMSEIEISRTIFRSGESEYRIGNQVVRLLDVQELLSESGIGRALHTVVGQGQLEEVLLARPEERRKYIEEAAGIAKHRRRKERAERKLAGLTQDLLRLDLIIPEKLREAHWRGFDQAMTTGQMRLGGAPTVTRGQSKSGERLYVEMTFALVRATGGEAIGSVAIARNVTARVERERAARSSAP